MKKDILKSGVFISLMMSIFLGGCGSITDNVNDGKTMEQNSNATENTPVQSETVQNKENEIINQVEVEKEEDEGMDQVEVENNKSLMGALSSDMATEQLELICENVDLWQSLDGTDDWQYAVTDLDRNGRLEIIAANTAGSGYYTTINLFEVNEKGDTLEACTNSLQEGESAPDIIVDSADCYVCGDKYQYVFIDTVNMGNEVYESTQAFYLDHGVMQYEYLCSKDIIMNANNEEESVTYMDADNNTISEDQYQSLCTSLAADNVYTQKFQWFTLSSGVLENKVKSSYCTFIDQ